jgi:TatA/E family protein of Tat protein translocase
MFGLSGVHLFIILVVVLIIFGPGKLPQVAKSIGEAINEFRNSVTPKKQIEEKKDASTENKPE